MSRPRLRVRNHQRAVRVDGRLLGTLGRAALAQPELAPLADRIEVSVHLVGDATIERLNQRLLSHAGPTDVITLDYGPVPAGQPAPCLRCAELFLGVPEGYRQARRFRTRGPAELVRYLVHGLLHLAGHDDQTPAARRRMKRAEDRLVRRLAAQFDFRRLERQPPRRV